MCVHRWPLGGDEMLHAMFGRGLGELGYHDIRVLSEQHVVLVRGG